MYHRPKDPNLFLLEVLEALQTAKREETPVSIPEEECIVDYSGP